MTMALANYHLALALMFVLISRSFSDYSGVSFLLTRSNNDKFNNPTAHSCEWTAENNKFCLDANSRFHTDVCQCTCDYNNSTFDTSLRRCRKNAEFRSDCNVTFENTHRDSQIKLLNLSAKEKNATINWMPLHQEDKIKSFRITRITFYESGNAVRRQFLSKKVKVAREDSFWKAKIKWNKKANKYKYKGKLFKVSVSYIIKRAVSRGKKQDIRKTDCFVFKSSGSTTVSFPSLQPSSVITKKSTLLERRVSSAPLMPSSSIPSSFSKVQTTTTLLRKTTVMVDVPLASSSLMESRVSGGTKTTKRKSSTWEDKETTTTEILVPHIKPSTSKAVVEQSTVVTSPDNKQQSNDDEGNNAIVVSLTVVGVVVVVVVVVILVVLWSRRRSSNPSKKRGGTVLSNRGTRTGDNTLTLSPLENIYAEADNDMKRSDAKVNSLIYDSADRVDENGYAQLDKSKNEQRPKYQSLVNGHANSYENIPGNTTLPNQSGRPTTAEPVYNVLDESEQVQDPCVIYHVLDKTTEAPNRELPARTGDENETNVYSVLEDDGLVI